MPPLDELDLVYIARFDRFQRGSRPIALTTRLAAGSRNGSVALSPVDGWPWLDGSCTSIPRGVSYYNSSGAQISLAQADFNLVSSPWWWGQQLAWGKLGITLSMSGISASLPKELLGGPYGRAATWGLFGNYDGDKSNDRQYPNGTVDWLAPVDIGGCMYHPRLTAWWESWRVSSLPGADRSMAAKLIGPDTCTSTHRALKTDVFYARDLQADDNTVRQTCNIDSTANISELPISLQSCYVDVFETGIPAFGLESLDTLGSTERVQATAGSIPIFVDPALGATYSVSLNGSLLIYFSAEAPGDYNSSGLITYSLISGKWTCVCVVVCVNLKNVRLVLVNRAKLIIHKRGYWDFCMAIHSSV